MQIKDVMTPEVQLISPETTLAAAAAIMRDRDFGALPVAENDRLVGMLTDRDIAVRGVAAGRDPKTTAAREIMSPKILYCRDDQDIGEVAQSMGKQRLRRYPVINRAKRLVGIVSLADLTRSGDTKAAGESLRHIAAKNAAAKNA